MESWLLEVNQWVANQDDCPELSYTECRQSAENMNCMGYALAAGRNVQPGEITLRRQLKMLDSDDAGFMRDSFNAQLMVRTSMQRSHFEEDIRDSLTRDGLERVTSPDDLLMEGHYPVALFFTETPESGHVDFHFLRLNSNGDWSWIPGEGKPLSLFATHPETLEDTKVDNPFTMRWPSGHQPDSVWLVPKGGYEMLLLRDTILRPGQSRDDLSPNA